MQPYAQVEQDPRQGERLGDRKAADGPSRELILKSRGFRSHIVTLTSRCVVCLRVCDLNKARKPRRRLGRLPHRRWKLIHPDSYYRVKRSTDRVSLTGCGDTENKQTHQAHGVWGGKKEIANTFQCLREGEKSGGVLIISTNWQGKKCSFCLDLVLVVCDCAVQTIQALHTVNGCVCVCTY